MNDLSFDLPATRLDTLEIRQRHWLKRLLPNTMFGRSLLLIVMPLILVQVISAWVFYARHWETVAHRFAADVAAEIAMLGESIGFAQTDAQLDQLMDQATSRTEIKFSLDRGGELPPPVDSSGSQTEEHLRTALHERLKTP